MVGVFDKYVPLFDFRFTLIISYYGLTLNTSNLHGSPYLNCFISGAAEIPAYTATWLALQYLHRRLSLSLSILLGGGLIFFIQLVPPGETLTTNPLILRTMSPTHNPPLHLYSHKTMHFVCRSILPGYFTGNDREIFHDHCIWLHIRLHWRAVPHQNEKHCSGDLQHGLSSEQLHLSIRFLPR